MFQFLKRFHKIVICRKRISYNLKPRCFHADRDSYVLNFCSGNLETTHIFPYPSIKINNFTDSLLPPIIEFFSKSFDPNKNDKNSNISKQDLNAMQNLGLFKLVIPKEYGGLGLTITENCRILEVVGTFDMSASYAIMMHGMGCNAISMHGNKEQKEKFLIRAANGDLISFCLGEPSVDLKNPFRDTIANKIDDNNYVLNGHKVWVPFGPYAKIFIVFVKVSDGTSKTTSYVLNRSTEGLIINQPIEKIGLRSISTSKVYLRNVNVSKNDILGGEGNGVFVAMRSLADSKPSTAASLAGSMKKIIEITTKYLIKNQNKDATNRDIRLIEMCAFQYATESLAYLMSCNRDKDKVSGLLECVVCKCFSTFSAFATCDIAMAILGAKGLLNDINIERNLRDYRVLRTIAIENDALKLFVAAQGIYYARHHKSREKTATGAGNMDIFTDKKLSKHQNVVLPTQNFQNIVHPDLISVSNFTARAINLLAASIQNINSSYANEAIDQKHIISKIGDIIFDIYVSSVVLSRATHSLNANLPTAQYEKMLAETFCIGAFKRIMYHFNRLNWYEHYKQFYNDQPMYKEIEKNHGVVQKSPFMT